jgi:hypothetical protein
MLTLKVEVVSSSETSANLQDCTSEQNTLDLHIYYCKNSDLKSLPSVSKVINANGVMLLSMNKCLKNSND